ncbi:DUF4230 domain-containing protein [Prevotella sp. lc2012]|uniref:DUF4230 domain-containing protein n=1 Tax=Prevotella sp. lc2012 TaxID=1761886 RepID=UPI00089CFA04|nr:DUF4230 domain-containing protein [Prevotella sp. lc2012]SEE43718.1 Protein of unknown function [Prevotella sp. lc2012]
MKEFMKTLNLLRMGLVLFVAALLIVAIFWLRSLSKDNHIDFGTDDQIDVTPTQIQSIKAIGEWEFLAVSTEEMVDTIRKGFLSNDELVRIYYGTARLGVNMHQVEPGWIRTSGDTVVMTLPKIGLLDKDFIDEARTKSFYESGKWKPADREALYRKAYARMVKHCMTKENIRTAELNAQRQMENMMRSMGFNHIAITFKK